MRKSIVILMVLWLTACNSDKQDATITAPHSEEMVDKASMVDLITKEINADPDNAELYYKRAEVLYHNENYDQAIQDLHQAIERDSVPYKYYHLLADSYLDNMQSKDGLAVLNRAVMLNPKSIPTLLKLSEYQLIFKMYENSVMTLNEIIRQDPQNAEAYFMLGMNFQETEERERAIRAFQTAVEIDPELIDGWYMLAEMYEDTDPNKAIQFYDNAILVNPDAPETYHAKAYYLQNHNQLSEAIDLYRQAIEKDPMYIPAFLNSGILFMELDSVDRAIESFTVMTGLQPEDPVGYYYRAQAELLKGDMQSAEASISSALNINPDYVDANQLYKEIQELKED